LGFSDAIAASSNKALEKRQAIAQKNGGFVNPLFF
jgi:hypothetical protein